VVNQHINQRRADNHRLRAGYSSMNATRTSRFALPRAPGTVPGWRQPDQREERIMKLWRARGLDQPDFSGGNVVAFLHQLRHMLP
jgi:hypothetical protein